MVFGYPHAAEAKPLSVLRKTAGTVESRAAIKPGAHPTQLKNGQWNHYCGQLSATSSVRDINHDFADVLTTLQAVIGGLVVRKREHTVE